MEPKSQKGALGTYHQIEWITPEMTRIKTTVSDEMKKNLKSIVGASQKGWAGAVGSGRERWAVWTLQFLLFFFLKNGHSRES